MLNTVYAGRQNQNSSGSLKLLQGGLGRIRSCKWAVTSSAHLSPYSRALTPQVISSVPAAVPNIAGYLARLPVEPEGASGGRRTCRACAPHCRGFFRWRKKGMFILRRQDCIKIHDRSGIAQTAVTFTSGQCHVTQGTTHPSLPRGFWSSLIHCTPSTVSSHHSDPLMSLKYAVKTKEEWLKSQMLVLLNHTINERVVFFIYNIAFKCFYHGVNHISY